MFYVLESVLPIFSIILLGYLLKHYRVITPVYAKTANQIVYYVAIPAMLFYAIARAPFKENFHIGAVLSLLGALGVQVIFGLWLIQLLRIPHERRGTFLHSSFHGNLGYMAYAIVYYALGKDEFARTAILSSFLMVGQNVLAIWALITFGRGRSSVDRKRLWIPISYIFHHPIILTVVAGTLYSALNLPLPVLIGRGLEILSGMALPTALLLIGASLSFGTFRLMAKEIFTIGILKLVTLPLIGYAIMASAHVPDSTILPGVILLAAPPATVTYVMGIEMGGDPELAAASISMLTLASAFSYSVILAAF